VSHAPGMCLFCRFPDGPRNSFTTREIWGEWLTKDEDDRSAASTYKISGVLSNIMTNKSLSHTSRSVVGRSLLLTDDAIALEQLTLGLQKFAISVDACRDHVAAASLLNTRKFEAIVLDLSLGERVTGILERVRVSPSNQKSITFALTGPGEDPQCGAKCNFVIRKPVDESAMISTLRAALGLIIHDYRRYFRCPVIVPVVMSTNRYEKINCEMINISEGGLAVTTPAELDPGMAVKTEFILPGETAGFELQGEICWCDKRDRAGLHFLSVSEDQKRRLQGWLSRKIEEGIPEPVARLFQQHCDRSDENASDHQ